MGRLVAGAVAALALLTLLPGSAAAQLPGMPPGVFNNTAARAPAPIPPYTGLRDISGANFYSYVSVMAYSAADRGLKLLNVCNSTGGVDVGCADMLSDASTGILVPATISGIPCPGANCTVKIAYNKGTAGADYSQATVATRPTLPANVIGTIPCLRFSGTQYLAATTGGGGILSSNTSWVAVASRTAAFTTFQNIISFRDSTFSPSFDLGYAASTNTITFGDAGSFTELTATASDSAFHTLQALLAAGGSCGETKVDAGSASSCNFIGARVPDENSVIGATYPTTANLQGDVCEVAVINTDLTASWATINTNEHSRFGF